MMVIVYAGCFLLMGSLHTKLKAKTYESHYSHGDYLKYVKKYKC